MRDSEVGQAMFPGWRGVIRFEAMRPPVEQHGWVKWRLLLMAALLYVSFFVYLTVGLDFSVFQSDVATYWGESLHLESLESPYSRPFSRWWVPGYPIIIAGVRIATMGLLPPAGVMVLISGISYVFGVLLAFAVARQLKLKHPTRVAMLFALYPFVGLTYSAWPISDGLATTLLLGCYLAFERRQWMGFTVCAACALMAHKAMWFFVPSLVGVAFFRYKESRMIVPLAFVPLMTWMVMGAIHYSDMLWFARWPLARLVASRSELPVLDGLLGPFLNGDPIKAMKGVVILSIVSTAVICAYQSVRMRFWGGLALTIPIITLALTMNQYQIWSVARFSRVLVIPLACVVSSAPVLNRVLDDPRAFAFLLAASAASNVAYGFYISRIFFA